jgi:acetylornithine deacetylase/succinyl-diaminopimelate desuccinylase-like protein
MNAPRLPGSSIQSSRIADRTYELVRIASPTGSSDAVAERYAEMLEEIGLEVTLDRHFAGGPNVVGRWRGDGGGPTLALVGHLDTIHAPHAPPEQRGDRVYGRGADDMKGAMAAVVEAVGALRSAPIGLRGDVVVAAHSLHEAPVGKMEGLRRLIEHGALGDAVLVAESFPMEHQILAGKGQAIFTITIRRPGEVVHENYATAGTLNPLDVAVEVAARLRARHQALAEEGDIPMLGPETLFIGEIHGGDFYNRVPVEARIVGIRRFGPARTWAMIEDEFRSLTDSIAVATGADIDVDLSGNGLGYTVLADAPIVDALARAHEHVTGRVLPVTGTKSVSDANMIVREGGIPAVCYGPNGTTAHADLEWVTHADLERAARVFAQLVLHYPGLVAASRYQSATDPSGWK